MNAGVVTVSAHNKYLYLTNRLEEREREERFQKFCLIFAWVLNSL